MNLSTTFSSLEIWAYLQNSEYESAQKELLDLKRMLVALTRKVGSERKNLGTL